MKTLDSDYVLRSKTRTRLFQDSNSSFKELNGMIAKEITSITCTPTSHLTERSLKDKRISLEAQISSIKQRSMTGISPLKPAKQIKLKKCNFNLV